MRLSSYEQESIILFNEGDTKADVYTHNVRWKKRLAELAKSYPDQCQFVRKNREGGETYMLEKKLLSIRTPYSEERRKKDRERALAANRRPPSRKDGEVDEKV